MHATQIYYLILVALFIFFTTALVDGHCNNIFYVLFYVLVIGPLVIGHYDLYWIIRNGIKFSDAASNKLLQLCIKAQKNWWISSITLFTSICIDIFINWNILNVKSIDEFACFDCNHLLQMTILSVILIGLEQEKAWKTANVFIVYNLFKWWCFKEIEVKQDDAKLDDE